MRIAFISDVHANFIALQAVLKDCETLGIDLYVSLGDAVTLGPQPLETLHALKKLGGLYIAGNHDYAALRPENSEEYEVANFFLPELLWCKNQLSAEDLAFIESFQPQATISLPNGMNILAFHGSPLSTTDVIQAHTPPETLDKYFAEQNADIFIGGHSHIQLARRHGEKLILNSGSVGNAFRFAYTPGVAPALLRWAEYMVVEQAGATLSINPRRVYFDAEELFRVARARGFPGAERIIRNYNR